MSNERPRNNFDGLRLLAALAVLFSHHFPIWGRPYPASVNIPMVGGAAVMAFFVISGYLVTLSWWAQPRLLAFAAKRVLRIWPALVVVVLLALCVLGPLLSSLPLAEYGRNPMTADYLRNLLLQTRYNLPGVFTNHPLANTINGSLWTIPIEVACYAVLAACGVLGLLRWRWLWALACLGYLLWFMGTMSMDILGAMQHRWEFPAYFVFGSLIATLREHFLPHRWRYAALAGAAALLACALNFPYTALLLFMPAALIAVGTSTWPVLSQAGRFGDVSYGVYLYAFPIQQTLYHLWPQLGFGTSLALAATLSLVAGWLSWRLVEAPALRLKVWLR